MLENINNGFAYTIKNNNINCVDLAKKLNITKQNISRWISSDRKIPDKYLLELSRELNVDESFLIHKLTDEDKMELLQNEINKIKRNSKIKESA